MRLFTATALSLILVSPMALAQTAAPTPTAAPLPPPSPAATQLAQKLYDDNHVGDAAFDTISGNVLESAYGMTRKAMAEKGVNACQALQTPWNSFQAKLKPMLSTLADSQFRQGVVAIYTSTYTESELRDITNFIESPAGKKYAATGQQLSQSILALAGEKTKPHEAQITAAMGDYGNSVKTALATCPAAAPQAQSQTPPAKKRTRK